MHPVLNFTVDHVLAVVLGGTDDLGNLVPACKSCNSKKHAMTVAKFEENERQRRERELRRNARSPEIMTDIDGIVINGETWYTTEEARKALGVSAARVRQLAIESNGEIGRKWGRDWMFTEADLDRMRQRNTSPGPKGPRQKEGRDDRTSED